MPDQLVFGRVLTLLQVGSEALAPGSPVRDEAALVGVLEGGVVRIEGGVWDELVVDDLSRLDQLLLLDSPVKLGLVVVEFSLRASFGEQLHVLERLLSTHSDQRLKVSEAVV